MGADAPQLARPRLGLLALSPPSPRCHSISARPHHLRPRDHSILESLRKFSRYAIPQSIEYDIKEYMSRYGRLRLVQDGGVLVLEADDPLLLEQFQND